ncbi:50S ribosomal protein L35 [Trichoplax sp. H2]|nr:50S ribosomal protein L35 [Trichoplax sp. H2]|eukprot:RDD40536.1 50S ribosomal protein L35 [Trichoplax sp. H2]
MASLILTAMRGSIMRSLATSACRYSTLPSFTSQMMPKGWLPGHSNIASLKLISYRSYQSIPQTYASNGRPNLFLFNSICRNNTFNPIGKQPNRSIVVYSKKGKRKTVKAVVKRFKMLGSGKIKRWKCGRRHLALSKSKKNRRHLRKPTFCSNKQAKLLKQMVNQKKWR